MRIVLVEPYYGGSHRAWADGYATHSAHDVHVISHPARFWKWRMHGAFLTLAEELERQVLTAGPPDAIIVSTMMDVAAFAGAKFGLRALAQSMARELGPAGIHVAHLIIDGAIDSAVIRERFRARGEDPDALPADRLVDTAAIAETYWSLHTQPRSAWTHELELRAHEEPW